GAGDVLGRAEPGQLEGLLAGEVAAVRPRVPRRQQTRLLVGVVAVGECGPPVVEVAAESLAGPGRFVAADAADGVLDGAGEDPRDGADDEQRNDHVAPFWLVSGRSRSRDRRASSGISS